MTSALDQSNSDATVAQNMGAASNRLKGILTNPTRGVVRLVDELLPFCLRDRFELELRHESCHVCSQDGVWEAEVKTAFPPKSVLRAILARIATLCGEQLQTPVSPYGASAELSIAESPAVRARVHFVNTADEQYLQIMPTSSQRQLSVNAQELETQINI